MAYEVKIYGEVVPFQDNWIIEQGGFVNLSSVQAKLDEANKTIESLNTQLSASQASNKLYKETVGKISALEQEFEEEKPGTPPKHAPKAESTFDEAIKNLRTIKLKK